MHMSLASYFGVVFIMIISYTSPYIRVDFEFETIAVCNQNHFEYGSFLGKRQPG